MVRRIAKANDYRDIVSSCPAYVIDDISVIKYFISGYPELEIEGVFEKVGRHLEVILPSQDLQTLPNGILMRKAYYSTEDSEFPDGSYNLEMVESLDVWLGEDETDPFSPGGDYLTADDLKTINNQSIVGQGNITIEPSVPDYYATKSWVSEQGYITTQSLTGYATESWVNNNFLSTAVLDGYATESWVQSQGYLTSVVLDGYATESWVNNNFLSSAVLDGYATEQWVGDNYLPNSVIVDYAQKSWVSTNFLSTTALTGYATQSWVESQGYLTSHQDLTGYATESWVSSQGYLSAVPAEYATESWVSTNFLSSTTLTGYATESWVSSQGYLTSHQDLTGYATESWVQSQGYLTEHQDLSSYATQSWATSQFLEESKVWTGTQSQWDQLTSAQKATYTIALITE